MTIYVGIPVNPFVCHIVSPQKILVRICEQRSNRTLELSREVPNVKKILAGSPGYLLAIFYLTFRLVAQQWGKIGIVKWHRDGFAPESGLLT